MTPYLHIWLMCFGTLAASVLLLAFVYHLLDSDLGTKGVVEELIIAIVASALQALVLWGIVAMGVTPHFYHFVFAAIIAGFIYVVTHIPDMERLEVSIICGVQFALYLAAGFVFKH